MIKRWIYRRFGLRGLVGLALLGVAFAVWSQWTSVKSWPGIDWAIEHLSREALPKADPQRFSVLVLRLADDDAEQTHTQLIVRLLQDFEGLQVLNVDRTIAVKAGATEDEARRGHAAARRYLDNTGASLAIWGRVLKHAGATRPDLFLTAAAGHDGKPRQYALETSAEFRLPAVFWQDLAQVLQLAIATQAEQFRGETGRYVADRLQPFIARVERLLAAAPQQRGWNADDIAATQVTLANALSTLGEQSGQNEPLGKAVAAYRAALEVQTREQVPQQWAATKNNLGTALLTLGEGEAGTARLEEAVAAYRAALEVRTRERVPLQWATTQSNLGTALFRLGERESGVERLEEAVAAFRAALEVRTREQVPLDWAMTQNNLGLALSTLGEREAGTARLADAVTAFRAALKVQTRERVPLDWATTQNNLGTALFRLGERESGVERLEEAVAAYRAALEVQTREQVPLDWAATQNNLGIALSRLGERESGVARLEEAVGYFRAALEVRTRARVPLDWAMTQSNLGNALWLLAERTGDRAMLLEAREATAGAFEVYMQAGQVHRRAFLEERLRAIDAQLAASPGG